jgi:hypothetical protein
MLGTCSGVIPNGFDTYRLKDSRKDLGRPNAEDLASKHFGQSVSKPGRSQRQSEQRGMFGTGNNL